MVHLICDCISSTIHLILQTGHILQSILIAVVRILVSCFDIVNSDGLNNLHKSQIRPQIAAS